MFGIGPVHAGTIVGFLIGLLMTYDHTVGANALVEILSFILIISGLTSMVNQGGITGIPGGLLTGFGLGVSVGNFV